MVAASAFTTHASAAPCSELHHLHCCPVRLHGSAVFAGRLGLGRRCGHVPVRSAAGDDQLIAPIKPAQQPVQQRGVRRDGRKRLIVKIPQGPARLRKDPEKPPGVALHPDRPGFEQRLTIEINSSSGPRTLNKVVEDYLRYCSTAQLASALSRLAGFAMAVPPTADDLQQVYWPSASTWLQRFESLAGEASVLDFARVLQSLSRLQLARPQLLDMAIVHTSGQLINHSTQAVAGLVLGLVLQLQLCQQQQALQLPALSTWQPPPAFMQELCIVTYQVMSQFSAQELSHLVYALSVWGYAPSQVWLSRCCRAYRSWWGSPSNFPAVVVRFVYALATLPPCQQLPSGLQPKTLPFKAAAAARSSSSSSSGTGHGRSGGDQTSDASDVLPGSSGAAVQLPGPVATDAAGQPSAAAVQGLLDAPTHLVPDIWGTNSSSQEAPSAPLPSFNWMTAFLGEARRLIDRQNPAALATLLWALSRLRHVPDLIFMEAWYTAAAAKMGNTPSRVLAMQLQALGLLHPGEGVPGAVPDRFLRLVVERSRELMGSCSAAELAQMLWGLAELRYWPGERWMGDWYAAYMQRLQSDISSGSVEHIAISDGVWALGRFDCQPPAELFKVLGGSLDSCALQLDAKVWAIVFWALLKMGVRPKRDWLVAFKARAAAEYDAATAAQLTQYVAQLLLASANRSTRAPAPAAVQ